MLMLLLGLLLGIVFRDAFHLLVTHALDIIVTIKTDLLLIKDRLLILSHIKSLESKPNQKE